MDKSRFAAREPESMENVREALKLMPPRPGVLGEINDAILAAALAEVEEWEKTVGILRAVNFTGGEKIASLEARAEAAESEREVWKRLYEGSVSQRASLRDALKPFVTDRAPDNAAVRHARAVLGAGNALPLHEMRTGEAAAE